jgi:copper chaperone
MTKETTATIRVGGMTCDACANHITRALKDVAGVTEAKVNLRGGTATVTFDPFHASLDDLREAIEEEGYTAA